MSPRSTADEIAANPDGSLVSGQMIGRAGVDAAATISFPGNPAGGSRSTIARPGPRNRWWPSGRPWNPKDVILTIDIDFQKQVDTALGDATGSAVVLDPRTVASWRW